MGIDCTGESLPGESLGKHRLYQNVLVVEQQHLGPGVCECRELFDAVVNVGGALVGAVPGGAGRLADVVAAPCGGQAAHFVAQGSLELPRISSGTAASKPHPSFTVRKPSVAGGFYLIVSKKSSGKVHPTVINRGKLNCHFR